MARKREEENFLDVNASMQGSLVFSDPVNLRINGRFEGKLTSRGNLIIGKEAEVLADIVGENVTVAGVIKGNIQAVFLSLSKTAQVLGNIEAARLAVEEGASFNGKCFMGEGRISLEELSDYLSIEENKIMEWVDGGKIPVESRGEKLMFNRREVEAWIASKT